jgi:hypothetical protein
MPPLALLLAARLWTDPHCGMTPPDGHRVVSNSEDTPRTTMNRHRYLNEKLGQTIEGLLFCSAQEEIDAFRILIRAEVHDSHTLLNATALAHWQTIQAAVFEPKSLALHERLLRLDHEQRRALGRALYALYEATLDDPS